MILDFKSLFLLVITLVSAITALSTYSLGALSWTLRNATTDVSGTVPGGVYSDLKTAGVLTDGDFYYRYNDQRYRWVAYSNWTYSTILNVTQFPGLATFDRIGLELEGVDTVATVTLNGTAVGYTDNMFVKYYFDVTDIVKSASAPLSLSVHLESPVRWAAEAFSLQSEHYVVPPACVPPEYRGECHANHIRKMQASFGWDWGPAFPSMGVWKPVRMVGWSAAYISDLIVTYEALDEFPTAPQPDFRPSWLVTVQVFLRVSGQGVAPSGLLTAALQDIVSNTSHVTLSSVDDGLARVFINLTVPKDSVDLWWPVGYGNQHLYDLTVTWQATPGGGLPLGQNTTATGTCGTPTSPLDESRLSMPRELSNKSVTIGFRQVYLDQSFVDPSNKTLGRNYRIFVNNIKIFLRGSNWIPAHALPELVTPAYTRRLLEDAVLANQNVLRVWGGGIYESDYFYQVADELGLLVWQDMMFACSMYPTTEWFLKTVRREVSTQIARLSSHPSIILWASNNENEAALEGNWYGTKGDFNQYKTDYVKLYVDTVRNVTLELDPQRDFVISSPSNGLGSEEEGYIAQHPYSNLFGDVHYYNYIGNGWNWTTYPRTRLASEYGFQSWPSFRSMKAVSLPSDWSPSSPIMDHRQHHPLGQIQLSNQIRRHFIYPDTGNNLTDYKSYLYLTQVHQAMAIRTESEFYRRLQSSINDAGEGNTAGALYWQLNDIWHGASWSSIEFGGRWKILHYYAKNFFSPVLMSPFVEGSRLKISAINDFLSPVENVTILITLKNYLQFEPLATVAVNNVSFSPQSAVVVYDEDLFKTLLLGDRCLNIIYDPMDMCFLIFTATRPEGTLAAPDSFLLLGDPMDAPLQTATVLVTSVTGPLEDHVTYNVTITSDEVALFVFLETDVEGVFSDNGFVLSKPNISVEFVAREQTSAAELLGSIEVTTVTDTYDPTGAWKNYWRRKVEKKGTHSIVDY